MYSSWTKSCPKHACRVLFGKCTPRHTWDSATPRRPSSFRRRAIAPNLPDFMSGSLIRLWERCRSGRRLPPIRKARTPTPALRKLVFRLQEVRQPVRLAVLLSREPKASETFELRLPLRGPLSDWV